MSFIDNSMTVTLEDGVATKIAMNFDSVNDYTDFMISDLGDTDLTFSFHLKVRVYVHD